MMHGETLETCLVIYLASVLSNGLSTTGGAAYTYCMASGLYQPAGRVCQRSHPLPIALRLRLLIDSWFALFPSAPSDDHTRQEQITSS